MATFHAASGPDWAVAVDGATHSRFGIQFNDKRVDVYIGTAAPADDTEDYVVLDREVSREIVEDLAPTEKVYLRSDVAMAVAVRGFRMART